MLSVEEHSLKLLIKLYKKMYLIRQAELMIEEEYHKDEMKTPVHLCIGQEAIAVGVCAHLTKDDYVFSTHRGHGHYLAQGGSLKKMIAELYCKETGCSKGRGGSMHLIDTSAGFMGCSSIVGGSIPIATGAGLTALWNKRSQVSIVFFGDGASEEGVLYESMNFAALKNLPVIYICENNFYSVYSHQTARQPNQDISMRAKAFNLPSYQVDATDVNNVFSVARKVVERARGGFGPSFLECRAYRWRAHAGAGDPHREDYRKAIEHKEWIKKDPVENLEKKLLEENILNKNELDILKEEINQDVIDAFSFARNSPLPDKKELKKYLFFEK